MKKTVNFLIAAGILMIFGICLLTGTAHGLIKPGELFPRMRFDLSLHKDSSKYFGLKKDKEIDISEINAEVLMVEVLSVYCVSCMSQTAYDRELYSMIEENKKTAGKVKMIGIGAGNNLREVNKFIDEFSVPYPVFPDYTFAQYNQVGQVRTPFKVLLRKRGGEFEIIKTEMGANEDVEGTFRTIVAILEGRYQEKKKEESITAEIKPIDPSLVEQLLKEWLDQRGEPKKVKGLFEDSGMMVYRIGSEEEIYAVLVNRLSTCDVCKEVQFIYTMDRLGNVLDIIPIHLSKLYNETFDGNDVAKVKQHIVSRNVRENIPFNSDVDAITSATITSGLIYDSINKGGKIYDMLIEKGYIK